MADPDPRLPGTRNVWSRHCSFRANTFVHLGSTVARCVARVRWAAGYRAINIAGSETIAARGEARQALLHDSPTSATDRITVLGRDHPVSARGAGAKAV